MKMYEYDCKNDDEHLPIEKNNTVAKKIIIKQIIIIQISRSYEKGIIIIKVHVHVEDKNIITIIIEKKRINV